MKVVMRAWGVFLAMAVLATATGCRRDAPNSPESAYRSFHEAIQRGNAKKAWSLLSPSTRQLVEKRSRSIAEASKGVVRDEPELLLFQGTRPAAISEITQVSADETSALLRVASASGTKDVKLVKDAGRWLIDLSDSLERRGTP